MTADNRTTEGEVRDGGPRRCYISAGNGDGRKRQHLNYETYS